MHAEAQLPTDKFLATRCPLALELQPCPADKSEHAIVSYQLKDEKVSTPVTGLADLPAVIRKHKMHWQGLVRAFLILRSGWSCGHTMHQCAMHAATAAAVLMDHKADLRPCRH